MLNSINFSRNLPALKVTIIFSLTMMMVIFSGCNKPKAPDFKGISNVRAKSVSLTAIELTGNAAFFNPNTFNGKIKSFDVDVMVNGNKAGKIREIDKMNIPPNQDVSIPFIASINPMELSPGIIADIVDIFSKKTKKLNVHYKGIVVVKASALSFKIPVDFKDEVEVKF